MSFDRSEETLHLMERIFSHPSLNNLNRSEILANYYEPFIEESNREIRGRTTGGNFTISSIPPEGLVITESGSYKFTKNIKWSPNSSGTAITIQASNVILNMKNYELICNNPYNYKVFGIAALDYQNIEIKNGKVNNFNYRGIRVNNCNSIIIDNISICEITWSTTGTPSSNTPVGIILNNCESCVINKCVIRNINVRTDVASGILIVGSKNVNVKNCHVKDCINKDGSFESFGVVSSEKIKTVGCKAENIRTTYISNTPVTGHGAVGFVCTLSTDLYYENCSAVNIRGSCDDATGLLVFISVVDIIIKKFYAENITAGLITNGCQKASGVEIYGSDVKVTDSVVKNVVAVSPQDDQASGFSCAIGPDVKFVRCKAENISVVDQYGNGNSALGFGTGFGWAPDPRPSLAVPIVDAYYDDCFAKNCQVGFDTWYHINSKWKNITTCNCAISVFNFLQSLRTISCSTCAGCSLGVTVTLTNLARNNEFINVKSYYREDPLCKICKK